MKLERCGRSYVVKQGKLSIRCTPDPAASLLKWWIHYRRLIIAIKRKEENIKTRPRPSSLQS